MDERDEKVRIQLGVRGTPPLPGSQADREMIDEAEAEQILGPDFFGPQAVAALNDRLRKFSGRDRFKGKYGPWVLGDNAEFDLTEIPLINYTEADLRLAKRREESLLLRVPMIGKLPGGQEERRVVRLIDLVSAVGENPDNLDWLVKGGKKEERGYYSPGADQIRGPQWALIPKRALAGSAEIIGWDQLVARLEQEQEGVKKAGAVHWQLSLRTPVEAFYDALLLSVKGQRSYPPESKREELERGQRGEWTELKVIGTRGENVGVDLQVAVFNAGEGGLGSRFFLGPGYSLGIEAFNPDQEIPLLRSPYTLGLYPCR